MDAPDGVWLLAEGDARFKRTSEGWVHGARVGAWHDLFVPGARDVTLEQLHGHRVIRAAEIACSSRVDVEFELPEQPRACATRSSCALATRVISPNWAWAEGISSYGIVCMAWWSASLPKDWERRRTQVIGVWAPELVQTDFRGAVAAAGLDERAAARDARSAAGYRRALVHRGAREFGLSRRRLAAVTHLSRGRIDQILSETVTSGSASAREARTLDDLLHRLDRAANAHREAVERLRAARHVRAQRVTQARDEGISLAQIAACLGVTRGRIQQLAAR